MTDLVNLIAYWKAIKLAYGWTMEVTMQNMIEQTIRKLAELQKLKGE